MKDTVPTSYHFICENCGEANSHKIDLTEHNHSLLSHIKAEVEKIGGKKVFVYEGRKDTLISKNQVLSLLSLTELQGKTIEHD